MTHLASSGDNVFLESFLAEATLGGLILFAKLQRQFHK